MSHLGILDVQVKIVRKGTKSTTGNVVDVTTAVLSKAKLGTMVLGKT